MTGKTSKRSSKSLEKVGIKKQYLKSKPICRVTFRLSKELAPEAKDVVIVGEFNKWNNEANLMKRLKDGDFTVTLELETGREYRFKYLIDGHRWENDQHADRYEQNIYGTDDSVVVV
ncbi:MAG: isoamylase early set domain-containing protein [Deltaproteobacteria bacterium]|nr:isoamylase early set domain-containing protein [Deltaproteobacteria bacterium]